MAEVVFWSMSCGPRADWKFLYLVHPEFEALLAVGHLGAAESPTCSFDENVEEDLRGLSFARAL